MNIIDEFVHLRRVLGRRMNKMGDSVHQGIVLNYGIASHKPSESMLTKYQRKQLANSAKATGEIISVKCKLL